MKTQLYFLGFGLLFLISSCKQAEVGPTYFDVLTTTQDENFAQSLFDDANFESDKQVSDYETTLEKSTNSDTIIITSNPGPNGYLDSAWQITVDFGDSYTGKYGWVRKGKIIIDVKGFYKDSGSVRTMTFDNYYVNNHKLEGTHTVTNKGFDSTTMAYIYDVVVSDARIITSEGKTITWNSTRTRSWTAGYDTPLITQDDVYQISGEAHGINSEGKSFSKVITQPLEIRTNCEYIQQGVVDLTIEDVPMAQIDFGYANGDLACDAYVQIHSKNTSHEIMLGR